MKTGYGKYNQITIVATSMVE